MGAKMIGTSIPNKSHRGVFNIAQSPTIRERTRDDAAYHVPTEYSPLTGPSNALDPARRLGAGSSKDKDKPTAPGQYHRE